MENFIGFNLVGAVGAEDERFLSRDFLWLVHNMSFLKGKKAEVG